MELTLCELEVMGCRLENPRRMGTLSSQVIWSAHILKSAFPIELVEYESCEAKNNAYLPELGSDKPDILARSQERALLHYLLDLRHKGGLLAYVSSKNHKLRIEQVHEVQDSNRSAIDYGSFSLFRLTSSIAG